jgi:hypothetical protein
MDKSFAIRIVDKMEDLYVENLALKSIIATSRHMFPRQMDIEAMRSAARKHPDIGGVAHKQFQELRDQFADDEDLEQALQAFLKLVPRTDTEN